MRRDDFHLYLWKIFPIPNFQPKDKLYLNRINIQYESENLHHIEYIIFQGGKLSKDF